MDYNQNLMNLSQEVLFKDYIIGVEKDRPSYYEMLYQKYVVTQDESDIIDLRTFKIIKNKNGTSKQVQLKPFGHMTKYKSSKRRLQIIEVLKKRNCRTKRKSIVAYGLENGASFSLDKLLTGSFLNFSSFASKKTVRCSSEITHELPKDKILEFSNHTEHVLRNPIMNATIDCLDFSRSPYHIKLKREDELRSKKQSLKKRKSITCETSACHVVLHQLQLQDGYDSDKEHIPTKDILRKYQNVCKVNEIKRLDLLENFEDKLNGQNSNPALNIDISKAVYFKSSSSIKTDRKNKKGRVTKNIIDYEEELLLCTSTSVSSKDISSNKIPYAKLAYKNSVCESLPCSPVMPNLSPNFKTKSIKIYCKK